MSGTAGELVVFWDDSKVGYLFERSTGLWSFAYDGDFLAASDPNSGKSISLRFPLQAEPYESDYLVTHFRNLLPDGELRRRASRRLGFSEGNEFALLGELCGDTFGALRIERPGHGLLATGTSRMLSELDLRNIVAALPLDPLLTDVDGYHASLSGAHAKIPVCLHKDQLALPLGNILSSHIVKPAREGLQESVYNEAFCMALAGHLGLPVAATSLRAGAVTVLICERFDRALSGDRYLPVHAEDFCQLGLLRPESAFEREGGLTASECVGLLRRFSVLPAVDIRTFIKWLVFNFLIGNGHGTAKQLAILHTDQGPRLAPFYGLSSTHVYRHLNNRLAMSIGKEDRPDWLIPDRWREFAKESSVRPKYVLELVENMAIEVAQGCTAFADDWQKANGFTPIVRTIQQLVRKRSRQVLVSLQAEAV